MVLDDVALVVAIVVLLLALGLLLLFARRTLIFRGGATVPFAMRSSPGPGSDAQWQGGVVRFDPDAMRAYRLRGVRMRPHLELARSALQLGDRRDATATERSSLMGDPVVLEVSTGSRSLELAMGRDALPGLLAWVEGKPVGH